LLINNEFYAPVAKMYTLIMQLYFYQKCFYQKSPLSHINNILVVPNLYESFSSEDNIFEDQTVDVSH